MDGMTCFSMGARLFVSIGAAEKLFVLISINDTMKIKQSKKRFILVYLYYL
jgi:hypothetical protein